MEFLCFILLTGLSQETITVNANSIYWFERESKKSSMGKEALTTIHFQSKHIRVRESMDEIQTKLHKCKTKEK